MDPYRVLKVSSDAPDEVIRAAYKVLASKYHPDKNPGNAQAARTMQHVNDAYALLSDPIRRSEYDGKTKSETASSTPAPPRNSFDKVTIHCRNCACAMRVAKTVLSDPEKYSITCPDCRQNPLAEPVQKTGSERDPTRSTIECKHCGQSLRVLSDAVKYPDRFDVTCPTCSQHPIQGPDRYRYKQQPIRKSPAALLRHVWSLFEAMVILAKFGIGVTAVIAIFSIALNYLSRSNSDHTPSPEPSTSTSIRPPFPAPSAELSQPVQPLPQTGDHTVALSNGVAPLTIKTSSSGGNTIS